MVISRWSLIPGVDMSCPVFMEVVRIFPGECWSVLGAPEGWIMSRVSVRSFGELVRVG